MLHPSLCLQKPGDLSEFGEGAGNYFWIKILFFKMFKFIHFFKYILAIKIKMGRRAGLQELQVFLSVITK